MTSEDSPERPGALPGGQERPSASDAPACDPVAVLAAQIAASIRAKIWQKGNALAETLAGC